MNTYLIIFRNGFETTVLAEDLTVTWSNMDGSLEGYKFKGINKNSDIPRYMDVNEIIAIIKKSPKQEALDA